jgi:hypothetical protein
MGLNILEAAKKRHQRAEASVRVGSRETGVPMWRQ